MKTGRDLFRQFRQELHRDNPAMFLAFQSFYGAVIKLIGYRHQAFRPLRFPQAPMVPAVHPEHPGAAYDGGDLGARRQVDLVPRVFVSARARVSANRASGFAPKSGVQCVHTLAGGEDRHILPQCQPEQRQGKAPIAIVQRAIRDQQTARLAQMPSVRVGGGYGMNLPAGRRNRSD